MHFLRRFFSTSRSHATSVAQVPIVNIDNGTFYRKFPSAAGPDAASNPALFPGLTFSLPAQSTEQEHWAVIGPSSSGKTTLLEILRGQHISIPPTARSFPYLSSKAAHPRHHSPARAIQYVGFNGGRGGAGTPGTRGAYLSARYESRREATDFTVLDYLKGSTDLNPIEERRLGKLHDNKRLGNIIKDLGLEAFVSMRMGDLSNGQRRRTEIAKALFENPLVLLLDEPFMGLDPPTIKALDPLLHRLAQTSSPRLILALRSQDPLPDWINRTIELGPNLHVAQQGLSKPALTAKQRTRARVMRSDPSVHLASQANSSIRDIRSPACLSPQDDGFALPSKGNLSIPRPSRMQDKLSCEGLPFLHSSRIKKGEALVEMHNVCVKYGDKPALGGWKEKVDGESREGLWWTVRRGERWGLFGPNGSGKTTLLSLICSDHPQSYSVPIRMFGRSRLPQPGQLGISIFDIQARIGQSSPEIHAFFPRDLSIRRTVESAWADTFLSTPLLTYERDAAVDACLRWFEAELNPSFEAPLPPSKRVRGARNFTMLPSPQRDTDWADHICFGDASFSAQRVALFLRAFVKTPDLVVLDEAFSGMDDYVRDKCMLFLTWGEYRYWGGRLRIEASNHQYRSQRENMIKGLSNQQALICVSHVKQEVPALVREWIKLPEASSGNAARFGRFQGPLAKHSSAWDEIWQH